MTGITEYIQASDMLQRTQPGDADAHAAIRHINTGEQSVWLLDAAFSQAVSDRNQ